MCNGVVFDAVFGNDKRGFIEMKRITRILLMFLFLLTGCVNVENKTMLYEIWYPQGCVTTTSMYGEGDYNTYHLESKELDGKEIKSVSISLNVEQEDGSASYKAVGEDGDFVLEFQYADGNLKRYEYDSDLHSKSGTQIVLRSEYLEDTNSLLVFVEEWNSHFYTAYIDGYLEQTEAFKIDLKSGDIQWKKKTQQNEFLLTADCTQGGECLYFYKEGAVYCFTGEGFVQVEKLGQVAIPDKKTKEVLVFDLRDKAVKVYYEDTPEKVEFEIGQ